METSVEQLIKERTFASLSAEELLQVKELCENEEEFQTMKLFFQELEGVAASRRTIINPEVKNSLDSIFSAKHPGLRANWAAPELAATPEAPVIPLHRRTWVRIAAAAILILGTVPFWNMLRNDLPASESHTQTAQLQTPKQGATASQSEFSAKANAKVPEKEVKMAAFDNEKQAEEYSVASVDAAPSYADADVVTVEGGVGAYTYSWTTPSLETALTTKNTPEKDGSLGIGYSANGLTSTFSNNTEAAPTSYGFTIASSANGNTVSHRSFGLAADLNPEGNSAGLTALSLADQEDVLDLIVPAF